MRSHSLKMLSESKKLIERSRVCHNHKPQPTPTPRRSEKRQKHTRAKQTNKCTRSTQSMQVYFYERCSGGGGAKSKDFCPTIKTFSPKKAVGAGNEVILCEKDKIVSDQPEVCEIFNNYFVNVAKDIDKEPDQYKEDFSDHPSMAKIEENVPQSVPIQTFSFKPIEEKYVHKIISNLNVKKATGADNISAKILKSCALSISSTISDLVNKTFKVGHFSVGIKLGQVVPLHKKKRPLKQRKLSAC